MNNKTYKVQSILKEFGKYNINLLIETKSKNFEINFKKNTIPHLLGLQYTNTEKEQKRGWELIKMVFDNNLSDQEILNIVEKNDNSKYHNQRDSVEKRINTFEEFMKNLEKGILVEKDLEKKIDLNYFLIQNKEKEIMHLGIMSSDNGALLVEYDTIDKKGKDILKTYFLRYDNNYYKNTNIFEKVKSIKVFNEQQEEYLPFSFDTEKQSKLDEVAKIDKNYDYHEALNKPIEEIKKEKQAFINLNNLKKAIIDYRNSEFADIYEYEDFDKLYPDLKHIPLAYTTTPDGMHEIQYELNLNDKVGIQYVDDIPIRVDYFKDENMSDQQAIDHMTEAMVCSSFDDLVFVEENDLKKSLGLEIDDDGNFYKPLEKDTNKSKGTVVLDDDWER
ncbi:PBECR4 domain-containing protein [uncultured Sneathia sp.]|uniref:PBECR4 domain-containing protein n=1 Tax=uncultured Sneathia sp. TaxID=278067 RepID=UPI00259BB333|nr:PBECR4 domain-containing protein [uncultured Sneathia sp.]